MRVDDVGAVYSIQVGARRAHGLSEDALRRRRRAGPLSTLEVLREISSVPRQKQSFRVERQTAKVLAREGKKDQEYVSSFLAALRAKAIESMHALLEAEADDDDA